jgi:hypothetical protein
MRWLAITLGLLAACVGLAGWIYLRDRDTDQLRNLPLLEARSDALLILDRLTGQARCGGCGADVSRRSGTRLWRVRLRGPFGQRCFTLNLDEFAMSADRGMTGIKSAACDGT